MNTEAVETGTTLLSWLTDYGALQVLAMFGLAWPVVIIMLMVYAIRRIGKPLAKIADCLEKLEGQTQ